MKEIRGEKSKLLDRGQAIPDSKGGWDRERIPSYLFNFDSCVDVNLMLILNTNLCYYLGSAWGAWGNCEKGILQ